MLFNNIPMLFNVVIYHLRVVIEDDSAGKKYITTDDLRAKIYTQPYLSVAAIALAKNIR